MIFLKKLITFFSLMLFALISISPATCAEAFPKRIVSLTPVGTEMLYALGQGDNVIAVTSFCDYPPEAAKKGRVGEYAEVNLERILASRTDLLVVQDMHLQYKASFDRLHIPYIIVGQGSIAEIYKGISELGHACGCDKRANEIVREMKSEIAAIRKKTKNLPKPRTLISVSRELSEKKISVLYAAGSGTFYSELLEIAGGAGVIEKSRSRAHYDKISQEGLMKLNPEVIIDLIGDPSSYHSMERIDRNVFKTGILRRQWLNSVPGVSACRTGRISILEGTIYLRPGPRLVQIIKAFAKALHPEVEF